MAGSTASNMLALYIAMTGVRLSDQQKYFASDFTVPTMSFSDPGTGKTESTIAGLILAQTYHKVPGRKINCMSFTRMATAEISIRYKAACKKCAIQPAVEFNTFHRLCRKIMNEAFPNMKIRSGIVWKDDVPLMMDIMKNQNVECDDGNHAKRVIQAINSLNSAMRYDPEDVMQAYSFKTLGMSLNDFNKVRKQWFMRGIITRTTTQGDIPLYALYALLSNDEIAAKWKGLFDIMVIDEFQDMTLLYLKILSILGTVLVVVGDMKQQIYGFNGASHQIVQEFLKMYPEARLAPMTRSFRSKDEISEFATAIVRPNMPDVEAFVGTGPGGVIDIKPSRDLDLEAIARRLKHNQDTGVYRGNGEDLMFLFRNNVSATPIAEVFYKHEIIYRMNKFTPIMEMDIFKELCELMEAALHPNDEMKVFQALRHFPQFSQYANQSKDKHPVLMAMKASRKNLLDVPFRWSNDSIDILKHMQVALKRNAEGKTVNHPFTTLLKVFEKYIIKGEWWRYDNEKEWYFNLVSPITSTKTYDVMVQEELHKRSKIEAATALNDGIRCYTIHTAKGLEADEVYIMDCEAGSFPSAKAFKRYFDNDCEFEAAKDLINERNLLYVAITRAKTKVFIGYTDQLTPLISSPEMNEFSFLDDVYRRSIKDYDNVGAFADMYNIVEGV